MTPQQLNGNNKWTDRVVTVGTLLVSLSAALITAMVSIVAIAVAIESRLSSHEKVEAVLQYQVGQLTDANRGQDTTIAALRSEQTALLTQIAADLNRVLVRLAVHESETGAVKMQPQDRIKR